MRIYIYVCKHTYVNEHTPDTFSSSRVSRLPPCAAGPIIFITLGILGIILWGSMDKECDAMYSATYGMLFVIFKIQVRACVRACVRVCV